MPHSKVLGMIIILAATTFTRVNMCKTLCAELSIPQLLSLQTALKDGYCCDDPHPTSEETEAKHRANLPKVTLADASISHLWKTPSRSERFRVGALGSDGLCQGLYDLGSIK